MRRAPSLRAEGGQSVVEFAFIMPFLVLLLMAIWQFGSAFRNYISITDAARVGARMAAVSRTASSTCGSAKTAIQNTVSSAQWSVISTRVTCTLPNGTSNVGDPYQITITYPVSIGLPQIFGLPRIAVTGTMTSSATERLE
jgi:Flp pilus assembly protein TadG